MGWWYILHSTVIQAVIFALAILTVSGTAFAFNCQSVMTFNQDGKWNKTFLNCDEEPVLNITNTTIQQVNVINATYNESIFAQGIINQTEQLRKYFGDILNLNVTLQTVLNSYDNLNKDYLKLKNQLEKQNPNYEMLNFSYYQTLIKLNETTEELAKEKSNKVISAIGGALAGLGIAQYFQVRQKQPEERIFEKPRARGEDEPIDVKAIEEDIRKRMEELKHGT